MISYTLVLPWIHYIAEGWPWHSDLPASTSCVLGLQGRLVPPYVIYLIVSFFCFPLIIFGQAIQVLTRPYKTTFQEIPFEIYWPQKPKPWPLYSSNIYFLNLAWSCIVPIEDSKSSCDHSILILWHCQCSA